MTPLDVLGGLEVNPGASDAVRGSYRVTNVLGMTHLLLLGPGGLACPLALSL